MANFDDFLLLPDNISSTRGVRTFSERAKFNQSRSIFKVSTLSQSLSDRQTNTHCQILAELNLRKDSPGIYPESSAWAFSIFLDFEIRNQENPFWLHRGYCWRNNRGSRIMLRRKKKNKRLNKSFQYKYLPYRPFLLPNLMPALITPQLNFGPF